ncbi:rhodanese-like domain-containing protein [Patescibacteria group bacterium]|nr:rhodanese-like domain-containing protein [Patescibacteria group bacterium]
MPKNRTKHETTILVFLVMITLLGIAFFVWRLWLPEKNENREKSVEEEKVENQLKIPQLSIEELKQKIIAGEELILLDVQSYDDHLKATLPETTSIPLDELNNRLTELPKNKTIITIDGGEDCDTCSRAAEILLTSGYTDIKRLDGGVTAWAEAGYPIASGKDITVKNVSSKELNDKITIHDDIVIVDVRELSDYNAGHIPGAQHVSFAGVTKSLQDIPRDKDIIVYDQTGNRSPVVVKQLIREGYLDTFNLLSGIDQWQKDGYAVEK